MSLVTEIKGCLVKAGLSPEGGDIDYPYFNSSSLSYRDPGGNEADICYTAEGFKLRIVSHNPFEGKDTITYVPLKGKIPDYFLIYAMDQEDGTINSLVLKGAALGHPEVTRFMQDNQDSLGSMCFRTVFFNTPHFCWG